MLFYVWEGARVWAHCSDSSDVHPNSLVPGSFLRPPESPQGAQLGVVSSADGLMASTFLVSDKVGDLLHRHLKMLDEVATNEQMTKHSRLEFGFFFFLITAGNHRKCVSRSRKKKLRIWGESVVCCQCKGLKR